MFLRTVGRVLLFFGVVIFISCTIKLLQDKNKKINLFKKPKNMKDLILLMFNIFVIGFLIYLAIKFAMIPFT